MIFSWWFKI